MRVLKQFILAVTALFTVHYSSYGQRTIGSLAIDRESSTIDEMLNSSLQLENDTNKVKILNRLSGKYWYATTPNALDSCVFYAREANDLSKRLHYIAGSNQSFFLLAKAYNKLNDLRSAKALIKMVYGEERVRLLLVNSEYYVFLRTLNQAEIDKAYPFMLHAMALSDSIHSAYWHYQSLMLLGKYYFIKGKFEYGKSYFLQIIGDCHKSGNIKQEAHYWSEFGTYMPETDSTFKEKIKYHQLAYKYYLQANDKEDAAYSLRDVVTLNLRHNQQDLAFNQMLQVLALFKSAGTKITPNSYWLLSELYDYKGRYKEAIDYGLKAAANDPKDPLDNYLRLAFLYSELNILDKSLKYNKMALIGFTKLNANIKYFCCYNTIIDEIKLGWIREGKELLLNFINSNPTTDPGQQELMAAALGNIYNALHQVDKAEINFRKMIELDKAAVKQRKNAVSLVNHMESADAYYLFGEFMVQQKQYKVAKDYLLKAFSTENTLAVSTVSNLEYQLFKADSALGNLSPALHHYVRHNVIKDSLFNLSKAKQIAELQLTFEAKQREQSISLLESQAKNQHTELQKVSLQRNLTFGGIIMFFIIAALLYFFYRQKKRSNLQLQIKQHEINAQNISLQQLVTDKNWLLKEVHHRVKNNLHIITSLLETQSSYINNNKALEAILESQSRIKAIALIHQRLYTESNLSVIEMQPYIHELVQYLKDSYDMAGRNVTFTLEIENINLDVQQAVAIGLIVNEAVTNSIKYAFINKEFGGIFIKLMQLNNSDLIFEVKDNGVGLPPGLDMQKAGSMGMELIKGLSKQLNGILVIDNTNGIRIMVTFSRIKVVSE